MPRRHRLHSPVRSGPARRSRKRGAREALRWRSPGMLLAVLPRNDARGGDPARASRKKVDMSKNTFIALAALLTFGCSASGAYDEQDIEEEMDLETLEQAINTGCGALSPTFTFTGAVSPALNTNSYTGGNCNSVIVDLNNFSTAFLDPALSPQTVPTTQAACEAISVRLFVFEKTSSGNVYLGQTKELGIWHTGPFVPSCEVTFKTPLFLTGGKNYRFALAVRDGGHSGLLRPIRFASTARPR